MSPNLRHGSASFFGRLFPLVVAMGMLGLSPPSALAAAIYNITAVDQGFTQGSPPQEVWATTISSGGTANTFSINWKASTGALPTEFVAATATVVVTDFTTTNLFLTITLKNTSTFPTDAFISAFGMATNPAATSVSISGGAVFVNADMSNFPSFSAIDVCAWSGQNCAGGGGGTGGLTIGSTDTFSLDIGGSFGTNLSDLSITLEDLALKFQGSSPLSYEIPGVPGPGGGGGGGGGGGDVPEPGTLFIFGFGLAGLALVRRYRKLV